MKTHDLRKKLHDSWNRQRIALLALTAAFLTGAVSTNWADALYILTGAEDIAIVLDGSSEAPDLSSQIVHLSTNKRGYDITLSADQTVTVRYGSDLFTTQSKNETVSALLDRLGIVPTPLEMVAVDLSGPNVELTVSEDITYYDRVVETEAFKTVRVANPDLPQGTENIVQKGVDGIRASIYEVVWSNGQQVSRQFVEEIDNTAVDQIVEYGTAAEFVSQDDQLIEIRKNDDGSGILFFQSGATLQFSAAKSMTATAYTAGYDGADYTTATGTFVHVGVVAVDKRVIPLGTRMYIVTDDGIVYGYAVAEDTGVRGNKVDLYHDTYEQCINFGRRSCTVYILE